MKVIAARIWNEPAVFLGFLVSLALTLYTVLSGDLWTTERVIGLLSPLATSLGIRQLVSPAYVDKPAKDEGNIADAS